VNDLVDKRLGEEDAKQGFVLDGYPRSKQQLDFLIPRLEKLAGEDGIIRAILIGVHNQEIKNRLGGRRACDCGEVFHLKFRPTKKRGICDKCGQKLYIRKDDSPEIIKSRLALYHATCDELIRHWQSQGRLIRINGEQSIKQVQENIINELKLIGAL
jgi:adenylate kinase